MKRILACLLLVIMLIAYSGTAESNSALVQGITKTKHEGEGFASPQEAALAYANALIEADLDAMVSTFAVETYTANYDIRAGIARVRSFSSPRMNQIPVINEFSQSISAEMRYATVIGDITRQYMCGILIDAQNKDPYNWLTMTPITFNDETEIDAFFDYIDASPFARGLNDAKIDECKLFDASDFFDLDERATQNMIKVAQIYGYDEVHGVIVALIVNGSNYALVVEAARYGDIWYNLSFRPMACNYLNINSGFEGLLPLGEHSIDELFQELKP